MPWIQYWEENNMNTKNNIAIEAKKIVKQFTSGGIQHKVLNNISFTIEKGEFVIITGRSGAGKSTLLYQLGLLGRPTSGSVIIDGVDAVKLKTSDRTNIRLHDLGFVFQDYALLPELMAYENVALPLLMQGFSIKKAQKKAIQALKKMGLEDKINFLPYQLSGGQQQRVSIARAIAHSPKIVFADEPTANLDRENGKKIMEIFKDLNSNGQTIILISHEQEYIKYGTRLIVIDDGKIIN